MVYTRNVSSQSEETTFVNPPAATSTDELSGESPRNVYQKKRVIFRAYQIIWYILGLIEILLAFRFFLKLSAASRGSGFTQLILALSEPLVAPFRGVFRSAVADAVTVEWATLLAMVVYLVIAFGIIQLFRLTKPPAPEEIDQAV